MKEREYFGGVYEAKKGEEQFIIEIIEKKIFEILDTPNYPTEYLLNGIDAANEIDHENVIKLIDYFDTAANFYLIFE